MDKKTCLFCLICTIAIMTVSSAAAADGCEVACRSDADCKDNNPYINETCINPGSCNASCEYVVPENMSYTERNVHRDFDIKDSKVKLRENINIMKDKDNVTALMGRLDIDKGMTEGHFLFIIEDPAQKLISRIELIHFNVEPFKVTADAIVFMLEDNQPIHAITYYIEPEAAEELIEETDIEEKGISSDTAVRKPNVLEKLYSIIDPDAYFSERLVSIIKLLAGIVLVGLAGIVVYHYVRKRREDNEIKLIK